MSLKQDSTESSDHMCNISSLSNLSYFRLMMAFHPSSKQQVDEQAFLPGYCTTFMSLHRVWDPKSFLLTSALISFPQLLNSRRNRAELPIGLHKNLTGRDLLPGPLNRVKRYKKWTGHVYCPNSSARSIRYNSTAQLFKMFYIKRRKDNLSWEWYVTGGKCEDCISFPWLSVIKHF